jgi:membrane fusion protein (multidrug efflux system)
MLARPMAVRFRPALVASALGALVLIAIGGASLARYLRADGNSARQPPAVAVRIVPVATQTFAERIEALGTARAEESVTVTARVTETVQELMFEEGQRVAQGDILATLVSAEESAALSQARATLVDATKQYRRVADLVEQGTETVARLDRATAERDSAAARVAEVEARLSDRLVRAPFAGVVGLRMVSPGALLSPGDAITTLDDIDPIKLDFTVPELLLSALAPGLQIRARSAAWPDRVFPGSVEAVDTRVDPRTRAVRVRARIDNPDGALRPGLLMSVELRHRVRESLAVPEEALVAVGERDYVYVIDAQGMARRVEVKGGARRAGIVEVREGLAADDRVVVEGTQQLRPGAPVRILDGELPRDVDL